MNPRCLPNIFRLAAVLSYNRIGIVLFRTSVMWMLALYLRVLRPGIVILGTRRTVVGLEQARHASA